MAFPYDNLFTNANKVNLSTYPTVPTVSKVIASEYNALTNGTNALAVALVSGEYHGLASNPTAPVSPVGGVRLRSNAGALEVSENGGAYAAISGGTVPDCSGTVAGKVNLVAQVMGAGAKTFENIISPSTYNTNGTGASDVCVKLGTSTADGSVNSTAKLISLLTGIGGTPVEKLSVLKSGYLTTASALAMLSDSSAGVSAANGASLRANSGVLEISQNGGAYVAWSVALSVDTPQSLSSSSNHIAISLSSGRNFYHAMTENTTLDAPTGVSAGMSGCIEFTQNASAAKTLAFNTFWKFSGSIVPALSTAANTKHLLVWYVGTSTSFAYCRLIVAVG